MDPTTTPTRPPMSHFPSDSDSLFNVLPPSHTTPNLSSHEPAKSRLPRLLSPSKSSTIPLSHHALAASSDAHPKAQLTEPASRLGKRKAEEDENQPPALAPTRLAGQPGKRPATALGTSTTRAPTNSRAPFAPNTAKKPLARSVTSSLANVGGVAARRAPTAVPGKPTRAPAPAPITRKPSAPSLSASTSTARAAVGLNRSRIGAARPGVVSRPHAEARDEKENKSAEMLEIQGGKIAGIEKVVNGMQELIRQDQEKITHLTSTQTHLQSLLLASESAEREHRRNLSTAGEELAALRAEHRREIEEVEGRVRSAERRCREAEGEWDREKGEGERLKREVEGLKDIISAQTTTLTQTTLESTTLRSHISALQNSLEAAESAVTSMRAEVAAARERVEDVEESLRKAETVRRRLHNQVQELKGNIRVFARVRPVLPHEQAAAEPTAEIEFDETTTDDSQQKITLTTRKEGAMGQQRDQVMPFSFDKVFPPSAGQAAVFEEISMLSQSVCDGYNVCIFAYGQTGSGKSWTMEGGHSAETAGMIPRAIELVFKETQALKARGWEYSMEGQYLEIYNETINDLLGSGEFDSKKHEIKHVIMGKSTVTNVTDVVNVPLDSPSQVNRLLTTAAKRRAVAATLMNSRSSRSHSVFTLKLKGANSLTGESCEGCLNLVDLAGSERMVASGADKDATRQAEAIAINKSLSALKDVIEKLGSGDKHVPYRNSKLTYLLQTSLSGQSKTLMLCNLSPLLAHAPETHCSLKFAKMVNNTTIGTARRQNGKQSGESDKK